MKCPRCGSEMTLDTHRKYPLQMCYNCGYMEGRNMGPDPETKTNFAHLKALNFNETVAFLADGLGLDAQKLADWLNNPSE
ncbi:MAG: hypothetical protein IJ179_03825 [Oscillospiraceae bacterium]|nr:hypothetical protein [Oscillospiraceae bacterium]